VPDGAYLCTDKILNEELKMDVSYERMSHLLKRIDLNAEDAYVDFKLNDKYLNGQPILRMSKLTERVLKSIDYDSAKQRRLENFNLMDEYLRNKNLFCLNLSKDDVPMAYPYLLDNGKFIKEDLIKHRVFVPTYWENVKEWTANDWERNLVDNLVCLPIDHRYGKKEIELMINNYGI